MLSILDALNQFLTPQHIVVSDVGDCLFACVDLKTDVFIGAGYYASMGLGIPGLIGAQLAEPDLRPIGLVGDGGFKMNGCELGTCQDLGLNPIVLIVNNRSFATLRFIDQDRDYFKVRPWDYVGFARSLGGQGEQATTRSDLHEALHRAAASEDFYVIDAVIDEDDSSPALKRLGQELGARFKKQQAEEAARL
jgi:indolepyruvate decarboxylase